MANINDLNLHIWDGSKWSERFIELSSGITSPNDDSIATTSAITNYVFESMLVDIVEITTTSTITDFNKSYSLQGTGSYTVTLPESTLANSGQRLCLFKHGNSNINQKVTVNTVSSQVINANKTTYTSLEFRFQGEQITLVSHGDHWDVAGEANIFSTNIIVDNQTEFINGIEKLNFLGGGIIQIQSEVAFTSNRTVNLTGIRIFADGGAGTTLNFGTSNVLTITGTGFYFDSVRFTGGRSNVTNGTSQYILDLVSAGVCNGKFEGCVFRNVLTNTRNTTNGNIRISRAGSGSGYSVSFVDCDFFTTLAGSTPVAGIDIRVNNNSFGYINIYGFHSRRTILGFNKIQLFGASGISGNNGNVYTDGSFIIDTTVANNNAYNTYLQMSESLITLNPDKISLDTNDSFLILDSNDNLLKQITVENTFGKYLSLDGGTITGNLEIQGVLQLASGTTVYNISTDSGFTTIDDDSISTTKAIDDRLTPRENYWDNNASPGRMWGGNIITGITTGQITIAEGQGLIKQNTIFEGQGLELETTPSALNLGQGGEMRLVSWNDTTLTLTEVGYNLIWYDSSDNTFKATLKENFYSVFDFSSDFTVGRVYFDGTNVVARLCGMNRWNFDRRVQIFGEERFPVERATGLIIGSTGTRNISISSGVIWAELVNRFTIFPDGDFDTSVSDTFTYWYRDGLGGWTQQINQTQINNTQWDNGSGTLQTLTGNRYGVHWVYVVHDSTTHVVFGRGNYTLAQADLASPPSTLPGLVESYATLVGKIIIQNGATVFTSIQSPFTTTFTSSNVSIHNELGGLQGGTTDQYYHLTANDYNVLNGINTNTTDDQILFRNSGEIVGSSNLTYDDLIGVSILNTTTSTSPTTGALVVSGGVGIGENLNVQNNIVSLGSISAINGNSTGSLNNNGIDIFDNEGGVYFYKSSANQYQLDNDNGIIYILNSNRSVTWYGQQTNLNTTESTSSSTGALIVSGGAGIAKNLNIGGSITLASGTTVHNISTDSGLTADDDSLWTTKAIQDYSSDLINSSVFEPNIVSGDTSGLVLSGGTEYNFEITPDFGNLIALDAIGSTYETINISVSGWTLEEVGTFRLDLIKKTGQTITFFNVEGSGDITLTDNVTAVLLFDKPYGTTTWYVKQNI